MKLLSIIMCELYPLETPYCCLIKGVIFKTYMCGLAWREHDTQLIIDAIESGRFTHKFYMYMFVTR